MKNPLPMAFRGAKGDEESRKYRSFRARFLSRACGIGMTERRSVFHQPVSGERGALARCEIGALAAQRLKERLSRILQLLFKPGGAIAIATRPGFLAIVIAAAAPVVRVLH